jgi:hypothetical protein
MIMKAAVEESSVRAHSGRGERGRRGVGGAVGGADAGVPFYRVRGGAGRSSIGEEWAMKVVHHNGDEGGRFGRGSTWVVVGSDEGVGVLRPLWERKWRREAARAHVRQRPQWSARGGR